MIKYFITDNDYDPKYSSNLSFSFPIFTNSQPGTPGTMDKNIFEDIYEVVRLIPRGRVTTYGAIAAYLGMKSGARMVGWAMNGSHSQNVPAHRVVNSSGLLTGKHYFGSPTRMQELLEAEGIKVVKDKIIDFKKYFWDPSVELL